MYFYETIGKERSQCGSMPLMKHRRQVEHFESIKSNAVGDPYVEPGFYDLRKPGPRGYGTGSMNTTMSGHSLQQKAF